MINLNKLFVMLVACMFAVINADDVSVLTKSNYTAWYRSELFGCLCILETRAEEETSVCVYIPQDCSFTKFICDKDLTALAIQHITSINWATGTRTEHNQTRGFLASLFGKKEAASAQIAYTGKLLVDEINAGIPQWWRLANNQELKDIINYLQKHADTLMRTSKPKLLISINDPSDADLTDDEATFITLILEPVVPQDNDDITYFLEQQHKMMGDIQNAPTPTLHVVGGSWFEKTSQLLAQKIKMLTSKDILSIASGLLCLYLIKKGLTASLQQPTSQEPGK